MIFCFCLAFLFAEASDLRAALANFFSLADCALDSKLAFRCTFMAVLLISFLKRGGGTGGGEKMVFPTGSNTTSPWTTARDEAGAIVPILSVGTGVAVVKGWQRFLWQIRFLGKERRRMVVGVMLCCLCQHPAGKSCQFRIRENELFFC